MLIRALGLIERWDNGVQHITGACREAGLASPVFEEIGVRIRVTLFTERVGQGGKAVPICEIVLVPVSIFRVQSDAVWAQYLSTPILLP
ncbi:MAG: ATP-binding protein [Acidobacteriota bacterium]